MCQSSRLLRRDFGKLQLRFNCIFWLYCDGRRGETWIHHYDLLSQREAKIWKKPDEKTLIPSRVARSASQIIITTFWDCEGVFLVDFLPLCTTINAPYYASLLHQLRSSIREECCKKSRRDVLLLHDNTPFCKSNITQTAIEYTGFTELNYPAYSLDLAPSDHHLSSNVKNFLRGRNFESDNDRESLFREP